MAVERVKKDLSSGVLIVVILLGFFGAQVTTSASNNSSSIKNKGESELVSVFESGVYSGVDRTFMGQSGDTYFYVNGGSSSESSSSSSKKTVVFTASSQLTVDVCHLALNTLTLADYLVAEIVVDGVSFEDSSQLWVTCGNQTDSTTLAGRAGQKAPTTSQTSYIPLRIHITIRNSNFFNSTLGLAFLNTTRVYNFLNLNNKARQSDLAKQVSGLAIVPVFNISIFNCNFTKQKFMTQRPFAIGALGKEGGQENGLDSASPASDLVDSAVIVSGLRLESAGDVFSMESNSVNIATTSLEDSAYSGMSGILWTNGIWLREGSSIFLKKNNFDVTSATQAIGCYYFPLTTTGASQEEKDKTTLLLQTGSSVSFYQNNWNIHGSKDKEVNTLKFGTRFKTILAGSATIVFIREKVVMTQDSSSEITSAVDGAWLNFNEVIVSSSSGIFIEQDPNYYQVSSVDMTGSQFTVISFLKLTVQNFGTFVVKDLHVKATVAGAVASGGGNTWVTFFKVKEDFVIDNMATVQINNTRYLTTVPSGSQARVVGLWNTNEQFSMTNAGLFIFADNSGWNMQGANSVVALKLDAATTIKDSSRFLFHNNNIQVFSSAEPAYFLQVGGQLRLQQGSEFQIVNGSYQIQGQTTALVYCSSPLTVQAQSRLQILGLTLNSNNKQSFGSMWVINFFGEVLIDDQASIDISENSLTFNGQRPSSALGFFRNTADLTMQVGSTLRFQRNTIQGGLTKIWDSPNLRFNPAATGALVQSPYSILAGEAGTTFPANPNLMVFSENTISTTGGSSATENYMNNRFTVTSINGPSGGFAYRCNYVGNTDSISALNLSFANSWLKDNCDVGGREEGACHASVDCATFSAFDFETNTGGNLTGVDDRSKQNCKCYCSHAGASSFLSKVYLGKTSFYSKTTTTSSSIDSDIDWNTGSLLDSITGVITDPETALTTGVSYFQERMCQPRMFPLLHEDKRVEARIGIQVEAPLIVPALTGAFRSINTPWFGRVLTIRLTGGARFDSAIVSSIWTAYSQTRATFTSEAMYGVDGDPVRAKSSNFVSSISMFFGTGAKWRTIDQGTAVQILLQLNPNFEMNPDAVRENLKIQLSRGCVLAPRPVANSPSWDNTATFSLLKLDIANAQLPPPYKPEGPLVVLSVPVSVTSQLSNLAAAAGSAVGGSGGGSSGGGGAALFSLLRAQSVLQLVSCDFDPQGKLSFSSSFTQAEIGSSAPMYTGAAIVGFIILSLCLALHYGAGRALFSFKKATSLEAGLTKVRFPSVYFVGFLFMYQPTLTACIVVMHNATDEGGSWFFSFVSFCFLLSLAVYICFTILRRFRAKNIATSNNDDETEEKLEDEEGEEDQKDDQEQQDSSTTGKTETEEISTSRDKESEGEKSATPAEVEVASKEDGDSESSVPSESKSVVVPWYERLRVFIRDEDGFEWVDLSDKEMRDLMSPSNNDDLERGLCEEEGGDQNNPCGGPATDVSLVDLKQPEENRKEEEDKSEDENSSPAADKEKGQTPPTASPFAVESFVLRYGQLFNGYKSNRQWFIVADLSLNTLAALIDGTLDPSLSHCEDATVPMLLIYIAYGILLLWYKPVGGLISAVQCYVLTGLQTFSLFIGAVAPESRGAALAAATFTLMGMYLAGAFTVIALSLKFYDWVIVRALNKVKEKKRDDSSGGEEDKGTSSTSSPHQSNFKGLQLTEEDIEDLSRESAARPTHSSKERQIPGEDNLQCQEGGVIEREVKDEGVKSDEKEEK